MSRPVRVIDFVGNLFLFVPLGASIALYAQRAALLPTFTMAFAFSFVGEWAQVYSRYRYPSGADLILNVSGAVLAAYGVDRIRRGRAGRAETEPTHSASEVRSLKRCGNLWSPSSSGMDR